MATDTQLNPTDEFHEIISKYNNPRYEACCNSSLCCPCHSLMGVIGFLVLIFMFFVSLIATFITFLVFLITCSPCRTTKTSTFPLFCRKCIGDTRLSLEATRNCNFCLKILTLWHIRNGLLSFIQACEYIQHHLLKQRRFEMHDYYYQLYDKGAYPYMFGVNIVERDSALQWLFAKDQLRTYHFGGMGNSHLQNYPFPHALDTKDPKWTSAVDMAKIFVTNPYRDIPKRELFASVTPTSSVVELRLAWNAALFYRCFGVTMTQEEVEYYFARKAQVAVIHYPEIFHFMICGNVLERGAIAIQEWMVQLILKKRAPRVLELAEYAKQHGRDLNDILRSAAWEYMVAGGPIEVIKLEELLRTEPKHKEMFARNPKAFVLEFIRKESSVPMSGHVLEEPTELVVGGTRYTFPEGVFVASALNMMDNDESFWKNPREMDITRDHSECVIFAQIYDPPENSDFEYAPRGCPGQTLGTEILVDTFSNYCGVALDD